jgi:hypothetical protein
MQIARPILATIKSVRIQPLHLFSQHLVSSSTRNYSKLQEIIESDQWPIAAYLCSRQGDRAFESIFRRVTLLSDWAA